MRGALLALLLALAPVSAVALSCMPHSVEAAYSSAQEAEERFVVVRGKLAFNTRKLPKVDYDDQAATPNMTRIKATLQGKSLGLGGFETPYHKPVTLAVACYGPWCASAQRGVEVLAFVELNPNGDVVATNPCGGYLFHNPTPKILRAVEQCMQGGPCKPSR